MRSAISILISTSSKPRLEQKLKPKSWPPRSEAIVSPDADRDKRTLFKTSLRDFGEAAFTRYRRLIQQAEFDVLQNPDRPGAQTREGFSADTRFYHLRHSVRRIPASLRVGAPRHLLVFRFDARIVEIVRVLHDAMDIETHLEPDSGNFPPP